VIASSAPGPFRILWLGDPDGDRFPAPGGDPISLVEAGERTVRFGLTDREGLTALDEGRARSGRGYDELRGVLERLLAGGTLHAGALLGPFGVRFVIAGEGDLPPGVAERLSEQLDLDRVPAGGLTIFRNAAALPTAFVSSNAPVPDRADPAAVEPFPGYGWAIAAPVQAGTVAVRFTDQWVRTVELVLLALLWVLALWVTRKPGSA
jgi:hypothetical protein